MYNRLLSMGGLFILTYLVTSLAFSKPAPPLPEPPARPMPILTSEEFKQTVKQMNTQTQSKLDMALAKLLGSSTPNAQIMPAPAAPATVSSTPQAATTTTPVYTAPASSGTGLNPYAN